MKRADLHRSRGTRPASTLPSRTHRTPGAENEAKLLPLYHWLQLVLCACLLLLLIAGQTFLKSEQTQKFQSTLTQHITHTIDLQHREWSGTLKEILFTEE